MLRLQTNGLPLCCTILTSVSCKARCLKYNEPKKFLFASSSSVYGDCKSFPLKETQNLYPKNIYALSKKNNEEIANIYSKKYKTKFIGLRFFTIFGELGRPDMFFFKLLLAIFFRGKSFN